MYISKLLTGTEQIVGVDFHYVSEAQEWGRKTSVGSLLPCWTQQVVWLQAASLALRSCAGTFEPIIFTVAIAIGQCFSTCLLGIKTFQRLPVKVPIVGYTYTCDCKLNYCRSAEAFKRILNLDLNEFPYYRPYNNYCRLLSFTGRHGRTHPFTNSMIR